MNAIPPHTPALSFDRGTLLLGGVKDRRLLADMPPDIWTWDSRVGACRCDALHYAAVRRALGAVLGHGVVDRVARPLQIRFADVKLPPLRPEQTKALAAWKASGGRGQIIMPTGTGKTEVALAALAQSQVATLVVAPVRDLMHQWRRRISQTLGYDAGIIGDNLYDLKPVTVTTYDSAYIHMEKIGATFGLIIFDEEHHLPGPCRSAAALMSTAPLRLGLTATPERSDGKHADLDHLVGPVVYRMPFGEARGQTLADFDVVRIPVALSDNEQTAYEGYARQIQHFVMARRKEKPGYTWEDLCQESGKDAAARLALKAYHLKKAIEDRAAEKLRVLEDLFKLHPAEKTIVFAGSNAMAMEVSQRFLLPTILAHTRKRERHAILDGFDAGTFPAIVANRVLDEGVDVPSAKVAVVIGGQASTRQAKQRLGRILRKSGNARATLYEVVCESTGEVQRSRTRRKSDAYQRTSHRRL